MERAVLLFDGECGFCTRSRGWLRSLDRHGRIDTLPYQQPGAPESIGASLDECAHSVQWRGPDGVRLAGAAAVNAALGSALGSTWPTRLYRISARPQERLYDLVARNRRRLPGTAPWCSTHPGRCGSSVE